MPALLPDTCDRPQLGGAGQPVEAYFAFYSGKYLMKASHIDHTVLQSRSSLPAGIFEQVRCKWGR